MQGLHEFSIAGVYITPMLVYMLLAYAIYWVITRIMRITGISQWLWHEHLFGLALYMCILATLIALASLLPESAFVSSEQILTLSLDHAFDTGWQTWPS